MRAPVSLIYPGNMGYSQCFFLRLVTRSEYSYYRRFYIRLPVFLLMSGADRLTIPIWRRALGWGTAHYYPSNIRQKNMTSFYAA